MKKLFETFCGKLVRLSKDVVGVVVGYTDNHFILLLEEGVTPIYCFSLDELEKKEYFIDHSFEIDGENTYYSYCSENNIFKIAYFLSLVITF